MPKKPRSIYYKRAQYTAISSSDLATLMSKLKAKKTSAVGRAELLDPANNKYRMISTLRLYQGCWCGILVDYTEGGGVPIVVLDQNAEDIDVAALPPQTKNGVQMDYLEGVLYFAILEDHVVFMTSQALRSKAFEDHLNYIFSDIVKHLTGSDRIVLNDRINQIAPLRQIKSIELQSPVYAPSQLPAIPTPKSMVSQGNLTVESSRAMFILRMLLPKVFKKPTPTTTDAIGAGNIRMSVRFEVIGEMEQDGNAGMNSLASALRHLDEDQNIKIKGRNGEIYESKDYKLKHTVQVETNEGVPVYVDAWSEMINWLKTSLNSKLIP